MPKISSQYRSPKHWIFIVSSASPNLIVAINLYLGSLMTISHFTHVHYSSVVSITFFLQFSLVQAG